MGRPLCSLGLGKHSLKPSVSPQFVSVRAHTQEDTILGKKGMAFGKIYTTADGVIRTKGRAILFALIIMISLPVESLSVITVVAP